MSTSQVAELIQQAYHRPSSELANVLLEIVQDLLSEIEELKDRVEDLEDKIDT